jgi:hypothetical protein
MRKRRWSTGCLNGWFLVSNWKAKQGMGRVLVICTAHGNTAERDCPGKCHAIGYAKLGQQRRDVELHRTFRHVEFRRNFLVREVLKDSAEHFLLAATDLDAGSEGAAGS